MWAEISYLNLWWSEQGEAKKAQFRQLVTSLICVCLFMCMYVCVCMYVRMYKCRYIHIIIICTAYSYVRTYVGWCPMVNWR